MSLDLYKVDGEYSYRSGFNIAAIAALVLGVLPCIPGFLGTIKAVDPLLVGSFLMRVYDYAWFVGFTVAFLVYYLLTRSRSTFA